MLGVQLPGGRGNLRKPEVAGDPARAQEAARLLRNVDIRAGANSVSAAGGATMKNLRGGCLRLLANVGIAAAMSPQLLMAGSCMEFLRMAECAASNSATMCPWRTVSAKLRRRCARLASACRECRAGARARAPEVAVVCTMRRIPAGARATCAPVLRFTQGFPGPLPGLRGGAGHRWAQIAAQRHGPDGKVLGRVRAVAHARAFRSGFQPLMCSGFGLLWMAPAPRRRACTRAVSGPQCTGARPDGVT
jgi:hypothetical protein